MDLAFVMVCVLALVIAGPMLLIARLLPLGRLEHRGLNMIDRLSVSTLLMGIMMPD